MRPLVVVRPEPGARATARAAEKLGLTAIVMPLFEIEPVEWAAPDPEDFDGLLLTSANALRQAWTELARLVHLRAHCVGEATAAAAREAGLSVATVGTSDLDGLLALLPGDLRLLHLCGVDHREPTSPNQAITHVPVYRAVALPAPDGIADMKAAVVAIHSPRAASRLAELIDDRGTVGVAAISAAAAKAAGEGWLTVEAADRPTDSALLALASRLCNKA